MMKKLVLLGAVALFTLPATAALAVPACSGPDGPTFVNNKGEQMIDMNAAAQTAEDQLRAAGVDAHQTRFWNGCIQTFVNIDGHDVMKFYDPHSLRELPVN
jgi:hypothetical protein